MYTRFENLTTVVQSWVFNNLVHVWKEVFAVLVLLGPEMLPDRLQIHGSLYNCVVVSHHLNKKQYESLNSTLIKSVLPFHWLGTGRAGRRASLAFHSGWIREASREWSLDLFSFCWLASVAFSNSHNAPPSRLDVASSSWRHLWALWGEEFAAWSPRHAVQNC